MKIEELKVIVDILVDLEPGAVVYIDNSRDGMTSKLHLKKVKIHREQDLNDRDNLSLRIS